MGYPVDRTEFTLCLVQHAKDMLAKVEAELRQNGAHGEPQRQLYHLVQARSAVGDVISAVRRDHSWCGPAARSEALGSLLCAWVSLSSKLLHLRHPLEGDLAGLIGGRISVDHGAFPELLVHGVNGLHQLGVLRLGE